MLHTLRRVAALVVVALAAACSESPVAPASAPADEVGRVPAAPSRALSGAATYGVTTCLGGTAFLTADEKRTLDLHNAQRAANGLRALCVHPTLAKAARAHSEEMLARSYFSHNSFDGTSFGVRLQGFGYTPFRALAENIAWGSGTYGAPDRIFSGWMNSTGHRANILNANLREIGIGVSLGTFKGYTGARLYTVDFGAR